MPTKVYKFGKEKAGAVVDDDDRVSSTKATPTPEAPPKDAVGGGKGGRYRSIGGGLKVPVSDDE